MDDNNDLELAYIDILIQNPHFLAEPEISSSSTTDEQQDLALPSDLSRHEARRQLIAEKKRNETLETELRVKDRQLMIVWDNVRPGNPGNTTLVEAMKKEMVTCLFESADNARLAQDMSIEIYRLTTDAHVAHKSVTESQVLAKTALSQLNTANIQLDTARNQLSDARSQVLYAEAQLDEFRRQIIASENALSEERAKSTNLEAQMAKLSLQPDAEKIGSKRPRLTHR